ELDLSYTKIIAPITGRIGRTQVSIGDLITANTVELATLVQLDPIWVNFQISEKVLMKARNEFSSDKTPVTYHDLVVTLHFSETLDYKELGRIDFVDNRVDQSTGTLAIRAIFVNPDKVLLPGQYTNFSITLPETESMLLISQSSVQEEQQGRFVLVVNEQNIVEKRMVTLGDRYGINWAVIDGVDEGDKVIVAGLQKVRVGIEVKGTEQTDKAFEKKASSSDSE
ncbi:MAG: efflux RND transporter periplasmic adaptor subunit, partial [Psychromonas sp.]